MSEDHTDPRQEQAIDRLYQVVSHEQPPATLDQQILDAAHSAVEGDSAESAGRSIWLRSLAYAAVMVLAVSVVIEVSLQPELMPTEPVPMLDEDIMLDKKRSRPSLEVPDSSTASGMSAKTNEYRVQERQVREKTKAESEFKRKTQRRTSEPVAAPAPSSSPAEALIVAPSSMEMAVPAREMMLPDEVQGLVQTQIDGSWSWRKDPQQWLGYCQQLLDQKKFDELRIELTEFQLQHTDQELPKSLQEWLEQASLPTQNP